MTDLNGYKAIVVGGAAGIGFATAEMLRARGARVVVLDRNAADAPDAQCVDLTDAEGVVHAMVQAVEELGGLDILVNSAGIDLQSPTEDMDDADWERILAVNLTGPMRTARAAFAALVASGRGAIVNVSSGAGLRPIADRAAYCSSKAGLNMLSKSLALDWAAQGIRVNCVCPGAVHSDLFDQSWQNTPDPEATLNDIRSRYALQRIADPEELAEAIIFLAGPAARHITGATLAVDGGRTFH